MSIYTLIQAVTDENELQDHEYRILQNLHYHQIDTEVIAKKYTRYAEILKRVCPNLYIRGRALRYGHERMREWYPGSVMFAGECLQESLYMLQFVPQHIQATICCGYYCADSILSHVHIKRDEYYRGIELQFNNEDQLLEYEDFSHSRFHCWLEFHISTQFQELYQIPISALIVDGTACQFYISHAAALTKHAIADKIYHTHAAREHRFVVTGIDDNNYFRLYHYPLEDEHGGVRTLRYANETIMRNYGNRRQYYWNRQTSTYVNTQYSFEF